MIYFKINAETLEIVFLSDCDIVTLGRIFHLILLIPNYFLENKALHNNFVSLFHQIDLQRPVFIFQGMEIRAFKLLQSPSENHRI